MLKILKFLIKLILLIVLLGLLLHFLGIDVKSLIPER